MDLVVGTGKVAEYLSVTLIPGEPAVTLEAEGLVPGVVLHVNVAQVPARKYPCGKEIMGSGAACVLLLLSDFHSPEPPGCVLRTSSPSSLGFGLLVDGMRGWVR